jgi:transglutaminase-like putative cysteine protease
MLGFIRLILASIFIFISFHCSISIVSASDNFYFNSTSTYVVGSDALTSVEHKIKITNKTSEVFPTQYAFSVFSTKIEKIWAKDDAANLIPKVTKTDNETTILVDFIKKSLGDGRTLNLNLGYVDSDITQQIGSVREMNLPKPANLDDYDTYEINLIIPTDFAHPVQMIPEPANVISGADFTKYVYQKSDISHRGVTAIFGKRQVFSFNLRYLLENVTPFRKNLEIALPPDTKYQKLFYDTISPFPKNIKVDEDGNWLAEYQLDSGGLQEIFVEGYAVISLIPDEQVDDSNFDLDYLLQSQPAWQTSEPEIISLAEQLKTPENIYNYVVSEFKYDQSRINESPKRFGALAAINNKHQALCLEFTDAFIALSRAAGIPAREINGYAYTQNSILRPVSLRQDILHAWPEYYDLEKKQWVQVDPTWGNTTNGIDYFNRFDLNHFTFVIHGKNDSKPLSPGFYKSTSITGKDIVVLPSTNNPQVRSKLMVDFDFSDEITAGITNRGTLTIKNLGNTALHNLNFSLNTDKINVLSPDNYNLSLLLPYTQVKIPITISNPDLFSSGNAVLKFTIKNNQYEKIFELKPITHFIKYVFVFMALGAFIAVIASKSRSILLYCKRWKSTLRRQSR